MISTLPAAAGYPSSFYTAPNLTYGIRWNIFDYFFGKIWEIFAKRIKFGGKYFLNFPKKGKIYFHLIPYGGGCVIKKMSLGIILSFLSQNLLLTSIFSIFTRKKWWCLFHTPGHRIIWVVKFNTSNFWSGTFLYIGWMPS